ncbi:MAG: helix-turn-helix domain-containing protein [Verrucomicrobia bacterium]|nr:helix-turn-helix domain-containing protein [Verrucomicrobiota bacterium]
MASTFSKVRNKPSPRRSRWFASPSVHWDLRYLGWGSRFYSVNPTLCKRAQGWSYQIVKHGTPILILKGEKLAATMGSLFIFGPDFPHGWTDSPDHRSELLTWIWKTPPRSPQCRPPSDGFLKYTLRSGMLRQIERIHAACRQEVSFPDEFTPLALERLRLEMDILMSRFKQPAMPALTASKRIDLAICWMRENLSTRRPVTFLCDYLQMSSGALERLFMARIGEAPSSYFHRLKMKRAAEMLKQDGMMVKEVAYSLGYTHANDFSRAFRAFQTRKSRLVK